ncbi:MAG: hypothetical protein OEM01_07000 [Desulfobulbaceae bacterium]|nr:hypothetical protein [Desulfobulbaceae bacterium]
MKEQTEAAFEKLISEIRIDAVIDVRVKRGEENIHGIIRQRSFDADVFFLAWVNRKKKRRRSLPCEQRTWLTICLLFSSA